MSIKKLVEPKRCQAIRLNEFQVKILTERICSYIIRSVKKNNSFKERITMEDLLKSLATSVITRIIVELTKYFWIFLRPSPKQKYQQKVHCC